MTVNNAPTCLDTVRVLELADERSHFAGKLLGDMGADVILVEPPGGCRSRRIGPFYQDLPDANRSLFFWHYNTSKRGITLNPETVLGRELLKQLVGSADIVIESFKPGYLDSLGVGYEALKQVKPDLIMISLTDFGQQGPWVDFQMTDALHLALGGPMASCGYDEIAEGVWDTPPLAGQGYQAWHLGGTWAHAGALAALYHRYATGEGQFVDVSIHDACAVSTENAVPTYDFTGRVVRRQTGRHASAHRTPAWQFQGKDGEYLVANLINVGPDLWERIVTWLDSEGMAEDLTRDEWYIPSYLQENMGHAVEVIDRFIRTKTADEFFHQGQSIGVVTSRIHAPEDLVTDRHLQERGFWVEVEHPELNQTFHYPGGPYSASDTPWRISRRAPLLGEHNEEIFRGELGFDRAQLTLMTEAGVI
jgi:crotonobetainyl-CoA:carnitine CoA-transferase CaiB-like acyl-CoA transferase